MKFTAAVCGPGVRPLSFNLLPFLTAIAFGAIVCPTAAQAECLEGEECTNDDRPVADRDAGSDAHCAPDEDCAKGDEPGTGDLPRGDDRPAVDGGMAPGVPDQDGGPAWSGEIPEDVDLPDDLDGVSPDIIERTLNGRDTFQENDHTCSSESFMSCDMSFCVKPDRSSCYYSANGVQITCDDCSDKGIESCGYAAARECIDLVEMLGCSASGAGANTNAWWMSLGLAGLFIRRSRRSRRSPRA